MGIGSGFGFGFNSLENLLVGWFGWFGWLVGRVWFGLVWCGLDWFGLWLGFVGLWFCGGWATAITRNLASTAQLSCRAVETAPFTEHLGEVCERK